MKPSSTLTSLAALYSKPNFVAALKPSCSLKFALESQACRFF